MIVMTMMIKCVGHKRKIPYYYNKWTQIPW